MSKMRLIFHGIFILAVLLLLGASSVLALSDSKEKNDLSPKRSKTINVLDYSVIPVRECSVLDKPNRVYVLTKNINAESSISLDSCIIISAEGITLDGRGKTIHGDLNTYGISSDQSNTVIKNMVLDLPKTIAGISIYNTQNAMIENVKIKTGYTAINLNNVQNSMIKNSEINDNYIEGHFRGIVIEHGSNNKLINNNLEDNIFTSPDGAAIVMLNTQNNIIKNNRIKNMRLIPGPFIGLASGIWIYHSSNNLIEGNTIESVTEDIGGAGFGIGISLESGNENNIFRNNILRKNNIGLSIGGLPASKNNQFISILIDSNNIGLSVSGSDSNTFSDIEILNSSSSLPNHNAGIILGNFLSNNVFSKIRIESSQSPDLSAGSNYQSEGTILDNVELSTYDFIPEGHSLTIMNSNGEIKFLQPLTGTGSNFMNEIKVENNKATIDASSNPGFDKPAQITLNLALSYEPTEIRIMRNNQICNECQLISWNPQEMTAIFNIPGQGVYSIA